MPSQGFLNYARSLQLGAATLSAELDALLDEAQKPSAELTAALIDRVRELRRKAAFATEDREDFQNYARAEVQAILNQNSP